MRCGPLALVALVGCAPAAVPPPPADALLGFAVGLHPQASARHGLAYPPRLVEVAGLGARAVLLPVPIAQHDLRSVDVYETGRTPARADLARVVARAHRRGLTTVVMPVLEVDTGGPAAWRGRLRPADTEAWFSAYGTYLEGLATWCAAHRVDTLVIGSELSSLSVDGAPWARLSARIRRVFSGRLAFVVNHDALDLVAPLAHVDLAGVSAYFPLTDGLDPSEAALAAAWQSNLREIRAFSARVDRPVVLFEVGYPSVDGAARRPWDDTTGAPLDLEEQRAAYAAAVDALLGAPEVRGVFFWTWFGPGGPHDRTYTPRGKPAAQEAARLFRAWPRRGGAGSGTPRGGSRPDPVASGSARSARPLRSPSR